MALTYYVIPLIFRKRVAFWGLAKLQPYLFAIGIVILAMSMIFQGIFGVPRRNWDISAPGAPFQIEYHPAVQLFQATMGIGGLLAIAGGLAYILIAVVSVFFGRPFRPGETQDQSASLLVCGSCPRSGTRERGSTRFTSAARRAP